MADHLLLEAHEAALVAGLHQFVHERGGGGEACGEVLLTGGQAEAECMVIVYRERKVILRSCGLTFFVRSGACWSEQRNDAKLPVQQGSGDGYHAGRPRWLRWQIPPLLRPGSTAD